MALNLDQIKERITKRVKLTMPGVKVLVAPFGRAKAVYVSDSPNPEHPNWKVVHKEKSYRALLAKVEGPKETPAKRKRAKS